MLDRLRTFFQTKALTSANAWSLIFGGNSTASSISVNTDSIMRCPAARGAIAVLAEAVGQLPLILYKRGADGSKERATSHPLYELLHASPNDWTSSFEFRRSLMTDLLLAGNAYAFINRSRATGAIAELVQVPATAVDVEVNNYEPVYYVTDDAGTRRQVDRVDLLHLRALGDDPYVGRSPLMDCREAIGLSIAMEQHAAKLFGSGARPAGVLEFSGRLSPPQLAQLRESFSEVYSGAGKSGKTAILEQGMKFTPLTFSSVDLQFQELRKFQVQEIARALRLPEHLLGLWERATWSNAEVAGQQFISYTLMPWIKLWEGAIHRSLLTPSERQIYYAELLVDDFVRANLAERFDAYSKAALNGILSVNEIRSMENRPPLPGGDELRMPLNQAPASQTEPANAA